VRGCGCSQVEKIGAPEAVGNGAREVVEVQLPAHQAHPQPKAELAAIKA